MRCAMVWPFLDIYFCDNMWKSYQFLVWIVNSTCRRCSEAWHQQTPPYEHTSRDSREERRCDCSLCRILFLACQAGFCRKLSSYCCRVKRWWLEEERGMIYRKSSIAHLPLPFLPFFSYPSEVRTRTVRINEPTTILVSTKTHTNAFLLVCWLALLVLDESPALHQL